MMKKISFLVLVGLLMVIVGCSEDDTTDGQSDNFDRKAMLENWADNIIIPSYESYVSKLNDLKSSTAAFTSEPTSENLVVVRASWLEAYIAWQYVGMFEIGKAEELTLINYSNVYPTNTEDMEETIASGSFNLASVNKQDEQGLAAIDYMINGLGANDDEIVAVYLQETAGSNHDDYLVALIDNLISLSSMVLDDWKTGYRDEFVSDEGSTATSAVNKLINDYIFYYEKHLRAGKIGIPAGVFSSTPLSDRVEALHSKGSSKILFDAGLDAMQDFFNGKHFGSDQTGESMSSYLDFLNSIKDGDDLSGIINAQFESARQTASTLNDNFQAQVNSDNNAMLQVYDQLQVNVVNLKVDMLQALNVKVDFVDADGD